MTAKATRSAWPARLTSGDWRSHLAAVALAALVIIALFARDAFHLTSLWWTSSTYSHCLLIVPILGWLVWLRADELAKLTPRCWLPGLLWVLGGAALWFVGDAASVALFRQLGLIVMLQGLVPALLGPQVARGLLFPLFYSLFLVPFGEELVPPMQMLTADMAMVLLRLFGIPAHIEGIFITTPGGLFAVAEACSGVKFLVAMAALSVLAAHLCFANWRRRAIFITFAMIVSVLANGLRAFGTIWMAEHWGIEYAVGADHLIYGWFFFGIVMAVIGLVAWPWFDRAPDAVPVDAAQLSIFLPGRGIALVLAMPLALLAAASPLLLAAIGAANAPPVVIAKAASIAGWTQVSPVASPGASDIPALRLRSEQAWRARFDGADVRRDLHFTNPKGYGVDVTIVGYARQEEGRELVGYGQGAVDPDSDWRWGEGLDPIGPARVDRIVNAGSVREVLSVYRIGDTITASGSRVKLAVLKARLSGGDERAYAIILSAQSRPGIGGRAQVAAFVEAGGGIEAMFSRLLIIPSPMGRRIAEP